MTNSTLWLSQTQFFLSLGFMSIFFVLELGLAWVLLFFKLCAHVTGHARWTAAYRFWVRVFALAVILTLASGMPVLIQVGTLWPSLMDKIGEVAGPLFAGAILTTFIVKSCFLGAMLYGQRRLSDAVHTAVVFMVAIGASFAALWMIVLQSWMQTPSGAVIVNGEYAVTNWHAIVFNPLSGWSAALLGVISLLTVAFMMLGITTRQTLRHPLDESERAVFVTGLFMAMAGAVLLAFAMAGYGFKVAEHQPAKAAATAGYWHSGLQPDLVLFAWPDQVQQRNRASVEWPHAGGRWLGRDNHGELMGLDQFSGMYPPVALTFWSFRLAVFMGLLMAVLSWLTFVRLRSRQYDPINLSLRWRHTIMAMTFSGWAVCLGALAHGLFGLSPYAVNGKITLAEIAGPVSGNVLSLGLVLHVTLYAVLLLGFFKLLGHIARYGVVPIVRRRGRA